MFEGVSTLLSAAGVLAGIVGLILMARPAAQGRALVLKDTLVLDTRRRLYLVGHGSRAVLLLTGGETDLVVGWLDEGKGE